MKSRIDKRIVVGAISLCIGLVVFVASCSRSPEPPPTSFIQLVAQADRLTATNLDLAISFPVTGAELRQLSTAVTNATRDKRHYSATFDWELIFCRGTNPLAVIRFQDRAFLSMGAQYSDNSGKLKDFYEKCVKAAEPKHFERAVKDNPANDTPGR